MTTLLKMKNIKKNFGGIKALNGVNFSVSKNQVHALVGENGAGKSTLMNVLSGVIPYGCYEGEINFKNINVKFNSIKDSQNAGISIVHQEFALVPNMSIAENIYLGNEFKSKLGIIDWKKTINQAKKIMGIVGLKEDPNCLVKDISVAKQQLVEIAKALSKNTDFLILDEPTASLNEQDSKMLLDLIHNLKKRGVASIIITHKLNEVIQTADKITVLRDGKSITTLDNSNHELSEDEIVPLIVGREILDFYPKKNLEPQKDISFQVKKYSVAHPFKENQLVVDSASFYLRKGEIVGMYGLQGSGCSELAMSLFGNIYGKRIDGEIFINKKQVNLNNPKQAIDNGLAYVTEDRKNLGLLLNQDISFNTTLSRLSKIVGNFNTINKNKEDEDSLCLARKLNTNISSTEQIVGTLSGGNQQKILLSKWLYTDPDILILDDPTRGIDVGAKHEIYLIMKEIIKSGKSILLISSELPELTGMCKRLYVMHEGKIIEEFKTIDSNTQEKIMKRIYMEDLNGQSNN